MTKRDRDSVYARLTGVVRRCTMAAECAIEDCPHRVLHEFIGSCSRKCNEFDGRKCVTMYGGEIVTEKDQGGLKLLRKCCNCGDIQETQHMHYDDPLLGWLCSACSPPKTEKSSGIEN